MTQQYFCSHVEGEKNNTARGPFNSSVNMANQKSFRHKQRLYKNMGEIQDTSPCIDNSYCVEKALALLQSI